MLCTWVVMFGAFGQMALRDAQRFADTGEAARALVEDKSSQIERSASGDQKRRYYLDLSFVTQQGATIERTSRVQMNEYNRVAIGDTIEIVYLRDDPQRIEVTPGKSMETAQFLRLVTGFSMLAVLVSLFVFGRRALDAWHARQMGVREEVQIETVHKSGWWIFSKGYRLTWRDQSGQDGKSLYRKADDLMGYRAGDIITVYHGRKRTWWEGDVGTRS